MAEKFWTKVRTEMQSIVNWIHFQLSQNPLQSEHLLLRCKIGQMKRFIFDKFRKLTKRGKKHQQMCVIQKLLIGNAPKYRQQKREKNNSIIIRSTKLTVICCKLLKKMIRGHKLDLLKKKQQTNWLHKNPLSSSHLSSRIRIILLAWNTTK